MTAKQIVKEVMKIRGYTQKDIAEKLGYPTVTGVANRLNTNTTKDMSVDTLVKFLSAMDSEVVIRIKVGDKKEWVITDSVKEG